MVALPGVEEKGLAAPVIDARDEHWPAHRQSVAVILINGPGLTGLIHEEIVRVQSTVLENVVEHPVQSVGAASGAYAHRGSHHMTCAGVKRAVLHLELRD